MSGKITDIYPATKNTGQLTKKFPQKKAHNEAKLKSDEQSKVYPAAKDVRDLNILRDFDLRCEYGPCIGITRLERWKRAVDYGLDPPLEVREIIKEHPNDTRFTQCIWFEEELI